MFKKVFIWFLVVCFFSSVLTSQALALDMQDNALGGDIFELFANSSPEDILAELMQMDQAELEEMLSYYQQELFLLQETSSLCWRKE